MTIKPLLETKKTGLRLIISILLSASVLQGGFAATALDKIAAIANDDVIMLSDVYDNAKRLKARPKFAQLSDKVLIKESLEQLILDSLQMQKARQLGIVIGDDVLNATMEDLARQNNLSLEDFQIALKREGLEYNTFREKIRQRLMISQLRRKQLNRKASVTSQQVTDLIANQSANLTQGIEYRIKEVVLPTKAGMSLAQIIATNIQAEQLREAIISGKDTRFNDNTVDAKWRPASSFPGSYLRKLALLEQGQVSDVFQDPDGFHIIKLVEKRGEKQVLINEYSARHILLKTSSSLSDEEAKNQLNRIRNEILAGANFADLAKRHSNDTGSALNGGELGWAPAGTYVPAFAKVLQNTQPKQISQPFKSKFGWHILQVMDKRSIDRTEVLLRNQAKDLLSKNKAQEEYESWLKQLRNDAFVQYRIEL